MQIYTQKASLTFCHLAALFAESVFVKQVFGHAVLGSPHAPQVGHPVRQFFDGLHLLIQEICLDEIAQLQQNINPLEKVIWLGTRQVFINMGTWSVFTVH